MRSDVECIGYGGEAAESFRLVGQKSAPIYTGSENLPELSELSSTTRAKVQTHPNSHRAGARQSQFSFPLVKAWAIALLRDLSAGSLSQLRTLIC